MLGCRCEEEGRGSRWGLDQTRPRNQGKRSGSSFHRLISKEKMGRKTDRGLTSNTGKGVCERQQVRTTGGHSQETASGLHSFPIMSAFQENKVVSTLSLGVCKQNTHLPMVPQRDSFRL